MTRYLVTGAGGMLGTDLGVELANRDVTLLSRSDLDITDRDAVRAAVAGFDVVINTAAYTQVDLAEAHEDDAFAVNATAVGLLAEAAHATGAILVQYSTDYVFNGTETSPYPEDAPYGPVSAYGRTKAAGEVFARENNPDATILIRTAWLYGHNGANFPATMVRLAADRDTLSVVNDQTGQPTWTKDLAVQTVALLDKGVRSGVFHGTNGGATTWFDFARRVFSLSGLDPERIHPTTSAEFKRPAPRPEYSVLGHDAWAAVGMEPMRDWDAAITEAIEEGLLS